MTEKMLDWRHWWGRLPRRGIEARVETTPRRLAAIAAAAFLARCTLFALVAWRSGATLLDYAESGDSGQYLLAGRAWLEGPHLLDLVPAARRFFPGTPIFLAALLAAGVPPAWAATVPFWLAAAATAVLAAHWAGDARVGWATAFLPPIYLYAGSLVSSETLALLLSLIGIVLASRGNGIVGGLALGAAMLCRPFAVFAALAVAAAKLLERRWRDCAALAGGIGLVGVAGLYAVQRHFGDALLSVHTYDQLHHGILAWPFEYLIGTAFRTPVPWWKPPYVWGHALFAGIGVALALRALRCAADPAAATRARTVAVWLVGLVGFTVCLASPWAFHEFPRLLVPALPALFVAVELWLPRSWKTWLLVGAASVVLALGPALRTVRPEVGPGWSVQRPPTAP